MAERWIVTATGNLTAGGKSVSRRYFDDEPAAQAWAKECIGQPSNYRMDPETGEFSIPTGFFVDAVVTQAATGFRPVDSGSSDEFRTQEGKG